MPSVSEWALEERFYALVDLEQSVDLALGNAGPANRLDEAVERTYRTANSAFGE
jgi:hypothetical protein